MKIIIQLISFCFIFFVRSTEIIKNCNDESIYQFNEETSRL